MNANLSLNFSTSWGKPLKPVRSAGSIVVAVDYDGTTARQIHIDTLVNNDPAKRLYHARIAVYDREGIPVFYGTYDELTNIIKKGGK